MSITFAHGDEKVAGGHVAGHVCMNIYGCYLEISTSKCYAHGTNSIRSSAELLGMKNPDRKRITKKDEATSLGTSFMWSVGDTHLSGFFMPNSSEGSDQTGSMSITFAHGDEKVAGGHVAGHVCMNIYGCYLEISTSKCYAHGTNSIRSSGTTGDEES
ncbi:hypothetical protein POM88_029407 [Heracleum sosnowskyi]|uniref:Uncharacterized protein n=1 Tax=Heracleum sosnowskyi TaxID=360622 RepID=A0AAD8HUV8_9APIA|nr:hypothetical protein POM88_029407 [Heracleum sosnowskyi]